MRVFSLPGQVAWHKRMAELPGVAEYLARRPGPPHTPKHPGAGYPESIIATYSDPSKRG